MNHKAFCRCIRCVDAKLKLQSGKPKRFLPKHVMNEILEKSAKQEELMLFKGYILQECPACLHHSYMKISPVMKCLLCCHQIK